MAVADILDKFVNFLRGDYPTQAAPVGYIPLLALLPRGLTDQDEALAVAELTSRGFEPVQEIDIRVVITRITGELASDAGTGRIRRALLDGGFSVTPAAR